MELAQRLKSGEFNPLKYKGESVRIDNIDPSEKEYVISEITSNMSDDEKADGFATKQLFSEKEQKFFMYDLIYDKDGMHRITKYEVDERKYD